MKKTLLSLAGLAIVAGLGGIANAQLDISDLFYEWTPLVDDAYSKVLNEYDNGRWYLESASLECTADNNITITASTVDDSYFDKAKLYRLFLSPYRVNQLKTSDPAVDTSKIIMKEIVPDAGATEIKFDISSADVDSNSVYYGFILPVDSYDQVWTPSKETCFQIASNICLKDTSCDTIKWVVGSSSDDSHGAASDCVGMDMANITHSVNGDTVTLKWTAVQGDVVQIAIFDPESEIYKSLGAVKMSDEKFDYKMQWDGEQNFSLDNGCKQVYYKADAKAGSTPEIVPAATWPAENVLYIAIAAIVLYGAYVVFFRKAENK